MLMEHSFFSPNCLPAFPRHSIFITTNLTMSSFPFRTLSFTCIFVTLLCLLPPSLSQTYKCFGANDGYSGDNDDEAENSVLGTAIREYLMTDSQASNAVKATYGDTMNSWCVGDVTGMSLMFYDLATFNEKIESWNVSSATTMYSMVRSFVYWDGTCTNGACLIVIQFRSATVFNQPIGGWNVSSVTDMYVMVSALCVWRWYLR
jgi:surface protein